MTLERARISKGSPLPVTPNRKSGGYLDLLQQFGTQSSATSVTKARRMRSSLPNREKSSQSSASAPSSDSASTEEGGKRKLRSRPSLNYAVSGLTEEKSSSSASAFPSLPKIDRALDESSEDELAEPPSDPPKRTKQTQKAQDEELKMEARRRAKAEAPRRSSRFRKSNIIGSDTLEKDELAQSPLKKASKVPIRPKLDTTRQRLRDEIAAQSKVKANNFLVANKDYFLPLLPPNNYVSKLVSKGRAEPVTEYTSLTEQPKGQVTLLIFRKVSY